MRKILIKSILSSVVLWGVLWIPSTRAVAAYSDSELLALQSPEETKIADLRNQELTQLRIVLGRRLPTNRRADLYLRVAELYLESYRAAFLLEGRVHEKRLQQGVSDPLINRAHSKPYLFKGIDACEEILRFKIQFQHMDRVYYFLGFHYGELERTKESVHYFELLTQNYPESPFVVEAYRALGEAAFNANLFKKAQSYYEMAAKKGGELGDQYPRVLHKLAWTYYKTRRFDHAVATMKEAVTRASEGGEKFVNLREEALRDMAIFMTEAGKVDEALVYFDKVAGEKDFYPKILEKLAKQYERNVEPIKAVQVYEALVRISRDEEGRFRFLVKLVDLDLRRGRYAEVVQRLKNAKLLTRGDAETETAAQNLRAMVRRAATEQHEAFRKTGNRASLQVADDFYSAYILFFLAKEDPRKETPEIQMYLADVKRELGKSKEASELYRKVIDSGDKRYTKEAAVLKISALSEALKKAAQTAPKIPMATEPSVLEREFVEAGDELADTLGDLPEGRETALRSAQILAGYKGTQKDAVKRIRKLIERYPRSQQGLTAARLWIQLYADRIASLSPAEIEKSDAASDLKEIMKDIRGNAELLAADKEMGEGKLKTLLLEQDTRFKVGMIAIHERDKDYGSAAKDYEAFATETTKTDLAEKAYSSAVSAYLTAGDAVSVMRVAGQWLKRFPSSKQASNSLRGAATSFLIQGFFDESAFLFGKLGRTQDDPDALETSARIHEGSGNLKAAQEDWRDFLMRYKKSSHHWAIALLLARSQGNYIYCQGGPPEYAAECGARRADLYLEVGDLAQAKSHFKKVAMQKGGHLSPFVAYSRYRLAEIMEHEAKFDPLKLPEAQVKKALNQRLKFLEPLSKAYLAAVDVGGPWGVAALFKIANWVMAFADEVEKIAPPAAASPDGIAAFTKNLLAISQPLRKKALQTWGDAYQKAVADEILSPVLPEIADRLGSPGRAQGPRGKLRLAGAPADGGEVELKRVRDRLIQNAQDAVQWLDYGNLLWGAGKPGLAQVCYARTLTLNPKSAAALNNQAVLAASGAREEDWLSVGEASSLLQEALKQDDLFIFAKMNRALLLNYYRVFAKAKPLWDQVQLKAPSADASGGLAIALQGLLQSSGDPQVEAQFAKAKSDGLSSDQFEIVYHEAARSSAKGAEGAEKCLTLLGKLVEKNLVGFEKLAVENLKRSCAAWKIIK